MVSKNYFYVVLIIFIFLISFISVLVLEPTNSIHIYYGLIIIFLGIIPVLINFVDKKESNLIPLMPLSGLFYSVAFGLPTFSSKIDYFDGVDEIVLIEALKLTVLGLIFLNIGFYLFRNFYSKGTSFIFLNDVPIGRQIWIGWIIFLIYQLFTIFPFLRALPSIGQMYTLLDYISFGILFSLGLDNKLSKLHFIFLLLVILYTLLIKVLIGSLAPTFFLLVFLGIIYWYKKGKVPWAFIITGSIVVIGLNPVKSYYRDFIANFGDEFQQLTYLEKADIFYESIQIFYDGDILNSLSMDRSTANRSSHLPAFAKVINLSPKTVPFYYGETYKTLFTSFVPRIIWPGKPVSQVGQDFGHRYQFLHHQDELTAFNVPWLIEFYANFGKAGVILGMFAVGLLFRFLVVKLSAPMNQNIPFILGITITFNLFYAESNFALMAGGLLTKYIACLGLLWLLTANYTWKSKIDI